MAKQNIFDVILNTISEVQKKNQANPRVETADPNVFDMIKGKLQQLDQNSREKRAQKGKPAGSILDLIRNEIEGARKQNQADPNVKTAPPSVFDNIIKKIDQRPKRQASVGVRKVAENYNLDISQVPQNVLSQVQVKYMEDKKKFDHQYAQALHDLIQRY
ncbi:MAG: hypothetical protein AB8G22_28215 [Saprospiraceae bacterium]